MSVTDLPHDRPGPGATVRTAATEDLEAILDLAVAGRTRYAEYQPVFWNPAPNAREQQRPHLSALLTNPDVIALVATDPDGDVIGFAVGVLAPAPPVYAPGGLTCLVDDFTLAPAANWATEGGKLLAELRSRATDRKAVQVVVVTAARDDAKRAALAAAGLSPASEWWVGAAPP